MVERFCREYIVDLNGKRAAMRAGSKAARPEQTAYHWLQLPEVRERINQLIDARAAKVEYSATEAIRRLVDIVTADASKLTRHHIGACRYCWGDGHAFQWTTPREYAEAMRKAAEKQDEIPENDGGFGYNRRIEPNDECPECNGLGISYTTFVDTDKITGPERVLFEGVKETREGVQFILADKSKAFERLADHLGIYNKEAEKGAAGAFANMLDQLLKGGSKAPIHRRTATEQDDSDE